MTVEALNQLSPAEARAAFERCCGASAWVERMCAERPFADRAHVMVTADRAHATLGQDDWLEAFGHHPRIGDVASLRERFRTTAAWAADEQKGAAAADEATLTALAEGNRAYERRFGYIFIVCATGKSAGEMLALLEGRMHHEPEAEMRIAAEEQMKITTLRLEKLLESSS